MILDTSAVVAILAAEPGYEVLRTLAEGAPRIAIGSPTVVETGTVLTARRGNDARPTLMRFLDKLGAEILPFTETHTAVAIGAFQRFGRGRHPAGLNLGDCMTYAVARVADEPLLCVGNDFAGTDLVLALGGDATS